MSAGGKEQENKEGLQEPMCGSSISNTKCANLRSENQNLAKESTLIRMNEMNDLNPQVNCCIDMKSRASLIGR